MLHDPVRRSIPAGDLDRALTYWPWLAGLHGLRPMLALSFGEVVLEAADGAVWCLDPTDGELRRTWDDAVTMEADLADPAGPVGCRAGALAVAVAASGLLAPPLEVYAFTIPPLLGGPREVDNVRTMRFVALHAFYGQVFEQVGTLPPDVGVTHLSMSATGAVTVHTGPLGGTTGRA